MDNLLKKIQYWFMAARGYSIPMSIINWLVAFIAVVKLCPDANMLYGIIALFGVVLAHLGTNLFDDCIDFILKVPKQDCKMKYLKDGFVSVKQVFLVCLLLFMLTLGIGMFFFFKFGLPIIVIAAIAAFIIVLYPKLNTFALGEIAVGLCFGILLFMGVNYVMTSIFDLKIFLISIPVGILTASVVFIHSIMDFETDKENKKYTLCVLLGTKKAALFMLMFFYIAAFFITFAIVYMEILPKLSIISLFFVLPIIKLYFLMQKHIDNPSKDDFEKNFSFGRNISLLYNVILILTLLIK